MEDTCTGEHGIGEAVGGVWLDALMTLPPANLKQADRLLRQMVSV